MGRSVKLAMRLLLLFFFTDYPQAEEIKGTKGKNITIRFTFERKGNNNFTFEYANLNKNGSKIEASDKMAVDTHRNFSLISNEPILIIYNLRTTDAGEYHVSLFYKEAALAIKVIETRRTILRVHVEEHITVSPPTSNHTGIVLSKTTSYGSLVYISIITGIVVIIMILSSVLLGRQYFMHNKSTDCQLPHQQHSTKGASANCQQVEQEGSSSVEYNVLDFQRRPGGKEGDRRSSPPPPQPQNSVEYSTITFFQGPHGTGATAPPARGQ